MPAKMPDEVSSFFDGIVQDGRLKVINAEERPDVWDRVEPCDDIRLIVGPSDMHPPEGVDIASVLSEFRPEPDAETQYQSWITKPESEQSDGSIAEGKSSVDQAVDVPSSDGDADGNTPADVPVSIELQSSDVEPEKSQAAMDRPWTSFSSRGFKG